jgi:hypothetical protein
LAIAATDVSEPKELAPLLQAVTAELPRVRELAAKVNAFSLLGQNRPNHHEPDTVHRVMGEIAAHLKSVIDGLQQRLNHFQYPFPHPRAPLTAAEYARSEKPAENEWHRLFMDSHAHAERLSTLHYRLVYRILRCAEQGELILEQRSISPAVA